MIAPQPNFLGLDPNMTRISMASDNKMMLSSMDNTMMFIRKEDSDVSDDSDEGGDGLIGGLGKLQVPKPKNMLHSLDVT